METEFFNSMAETKKEIEEYLKEFYFEPNNEETRKSITDGVNEILEKNDVGSWKIEFKDGYKSFSVILKTDFELTYFIKGE